MRELERQAVGEDPRGSGDAERARRQFPAVDWQRAKSPRAEGQAFALKMYQVFEETVLTLEVLRSEERTSRPDYRLQSAHAVTQ